MLADSSTGADSNLLAGDGLSSRHLHGQFSEGPG